MNDGDDVGPDDGEDVGEVEGPAVVGCSLCVRKTLSIKRREISTSMSI